MVRDLEIKQLSDRVSSITRLNTTSSSECMNAEAYQVINYGIGGQYEAHHDFTEDRSKLANLPHFLVGTGDRISTFMFYLSHVEYGGATVFPELNLQVKPTKNGAVFWYNFQLSGDFDFRTLHAGCPVLLGQKWVSNKWIRERGQEFTRPCGLSIDAKDI